MVVQTLTLLLAVVCLAAFALGVAGLFRRSTTLLVGAAVLAMPVVGFAAASLVLA